MEEACYGEGSIKMKEKEKEKERTSKLGSVEATSEGVVVDVGSVRFDGNEGFVRKMGGRGGASNSGELGLTVEMELGSDGHR